jgi:hypothetical protein
MNLGQGRYFTSSVTSVLGTYAPLGYLKTPKHRWVLPISTVSICLNGMRMRYLSLPGAPVLLLQYNVKLSW